jgi:hypothetical protein
LVEPSTPSEKVPRLMLSARPSRSAYSSTASSPRRAPELAANPTSRRGLARLRRPSVATMSMRGRPPAPPWPGRPESRRRTGAGVPRRCCGAAAVWPRWAAPATVTITGSGNISLVDNTDLSGWANCQPDRVSSARIRVASERAHSVSTVPPARADVNALTGLRGAPSSVGYHSGPSRASS